MIIAELRNDSPFTYESTTICATMRSKAAQLLEVASTSPFPSTIRPGETHVFPMFFNSFDGSEFEFFAFGSPDYGRVMSLDPSAITVHATRIVRTGFGPVLMVAGEFHNSTPLDLNSIKLSAHAGDSLVSRVDQVPLGCGGARAGDRIPVAFAVPLGGSQGGTPVIEGIEANHEMSLYALSISGVKLVRQENGLWTVSATIQNESAFAIHPHGACLGVRDDTGAVVGAVSRGPFYELLPPGGSMPITGDVEALSDPTSAEVIVYGYPSAPR